MQSKHSVYDRDHDMKFDGSPSKGTQAVFFARIGGQGEMNVCRCSAACQLCRNIMGQSEIVRRDTYSEVGSPLEYFLFDHTMLVLLDSRHTLTILMTRSSASPLTTGDAYD
jgi:hypothetical protein